MEPETKEKMAAFSTPSASPVSSSAGQIVWQWVCYSLWEWTLIALCTLLSATLAYFFVSDDSSSYAFIIYVLAATICLLPMAFVVDRMYSKQEPEQKHGFGAVVMVLNAVLVFLATVGALITAVVSTISLAIEPPSDGRTVTIISSLIVAILGGMLFVRIVNPVRLRAFTKFFGWIVLGVASLAIVLSIAGPFRNLISTRNDRLIEDNLYLLSSEIDNYTNDNDGKLPESLAELHISDTYNDGVKELVDRNMVRYEANTKDAEPDEYDEYDELDESTSYSGTSSETYYYKLCVTYEKAKGNGRNSKDLYGATNNHSAGEACYEQTATVY